LSTNRVRIEAAHRFAVGRQAGFDYITDPGNWNEYWPGFVRLEPGCRWSAPGDQALLVFRLLGRETDMTMTLGRIERGRLVEYESRQRGLPAARHERHFSDDGSGGLAYRVVVEYVPRGGLRGILDRVLVRRAIRRAVLRTIANLEERFRSL
jgi:Polyketide cyclase / dehydrase and lipid transport